MKPKNILNFYLTLYLCFIFNYYLNMYFICTFNFIQTNKKQNKLHGLSPRANYTDRATAASRRSNCQLLRIKGATWSA
jgi:hypothetical protein